MTPLRIVFAVAVFTLAATIPVDASAGALGRAIGRGAAKSLARATGRGAERSAIRTPARALLRRDHARDLRTVPKSLARPRTMYRYAPAPRAKVEVRRGIPPGRHLASRRAVGRPLGARRAQKVYGLPKKPGAVETVRIPAKQPVRVNKVIGGAPGRGEVTSPNRIPAGAIRSVHRLR
jgi:hypothetical protein